MPPKATGRKRHPEEHGWYNSLGHLCARSAPNVDEQWFTDVCQEPFLVPERNLSRLISALLFVEITGAPGAKRFANGDWSEIAIIMPLISRIMNSVGWSSFVMGKFLILCERAADA